DVRARSINEKMKVAASYALASLAKQGADESVAKAYGESHFEFGPEYIVPKPFDPRVFVWESVAVAQAAMQSGSANVEIDIEEYREKLERKVAGKSSKAKRHTKRKVANR
ncbi:MAG: NADP-dependent malic enzyme, partial [Thermodesulfobacteriota bacterium]